MQQQSHVPVTSLACVQGSLRRPSHRAKFVAAIAAFCEPVAKARLVRTDLSPGYRSAPRAFHMYFYLSDPAAIDVRVG